VLRNVSLEILPKAVTAIIGPSGCGKSTFLRSLNRMHDLVPIARVEGRITLFGEDLYARGVDATLVRRRVGMVFQKSNPFPTMSIAENVTVGLRLNGLRQKNLILERMERSLRMAALWEEVKDKLSTNGLSLSGGQQQRLCIARTVAVRPEVILFDEPCSALDPLSTAQIEELIVKLSSEVAIGLVTHNMFQATRVSDFTAVFLLGAGSVGELVEFGPTAQVFDSPSDPRTEAYVTGKVG
jgi:phosphate transport system ATP-binding protein